MELIKNTSRFPEVGSCIYCGSNDELTDEHIIPFALGGKLILPKSSCIECNSITSKFERRVLRGFMLPIRTSVEYPTRKPKNRPKDFEFEVVEDGIKKTIVMDANNFPAILFLPEFNTPGIFNNRKSKGNFQVVATEIIKSGKDPDFFFRKYGFEKLKISTKVDPYSFVRMLAKIGYSYYVGVAGKLPLEDVSILPFLLGNSDDGDYWIGSTAFPDENDFTNIPHYISYNKYPSYTNPKIYLDVVHIVLFASAGASGYDVVIRSYNA